MSTPRIFYQDEQSTIWLGDCHTVLPLLAPVDLVLTDPPYPQLKGGTKITFTSRVGRQHINTRTVGTPWGGDISALGYCSQVARLGGLVFCSWHWLEHLPSLLGGEKVALLTWQQRNAMPSANNVPHFSTEFVWAIKYAPGLRWKALRTFYDIPRLQPGCIANPERYVDRYGAALHPTQKPLALIRQLLLCQPCSVLDPYCGTGTTLVAAKQLGIAAVGIEISEEYCRIAVERLKQDVLPLKAKPPPVSVQEPLL